MNLDTFVRIPFGAALSVATLLLIASYEVINLRGLKAPIWLRPLTLSLVVALFVVIIARFARFV